MHFLPGIFAGAGYEVESNREHGEGRSDIIIYAPADGKAGQSLRQNIQKGRNAAGRLRSGSTADR